MKRHLKWAIPLLALGLLAGWLFVGGDEFQIGRTARELAGQPAVRSADVVGSAETTDELVEVTMDPAATPEQLEVVLATAARLSTRDPQPKMAVRMGNASARVTHDSAVTDLALTLASLSGFRDGHPRVEDRSVALGAVDSPLLTAQDLGTRLLDGGAPVDRLVLEHQDGSDAVRVDDLSREQVDVVGALVDQQAQIEAARLLGYVVEISPATGNPDALEALARAAHRAVQPLDGAGFEIEPADFRIRGATDPGAAFDVVDHFAADDLQVTSITTNLTAIEVGSDERQLDQSNLGVVDQILSAGDFDIHPEGTITVTPTSSYQPEPIFSGTPDDLHRRHARLARAQTDTGHRVSWIRDNGPATEVRLTVTVGAATDRDAMDEEMAQALAAVRTVGWPGLGRVTVLTDSAEDEGWGDIGLSSTEDGAAQDVIVSDEAEFDEESVREIWDAIPAG